MKKYFYKGLFLVPVLWMLACIDTNDDGGPVDRDPETGVPVQISYQVLNKYPFDSTLFTQGLQYLNGRLLAGGGQYGESRVQFMDLKTGTVEKRTDNPKAIFGEGVTEIGGRIYQLTWKEGHAIIYDSASLAKTAEIPYHFGEGWGIANNGRELIISNGTSNLFFYDPHTFKEISRIGVTDAYGPVANLNELEFIDGHVFANIWGQDRIVKIEPASGKVVGEMNLAALRQSAGLPPLGMGNEKSPEVLNGIAWDSAGRRMFVTGKYWPVLYELKLN